jgi:type II secretory pathway component GspD/PulD (secretin)
VKLPYQIRTWTKVSALLCALAIGVNAGAEETAPEITPEPAAEAPAETMEVPVEPAEGDDVAPVAEGDEVPVAEGDEVPVAEGDEVPVAEGEEPVEEEPTADPVMTKAESELAKYADELARLQEGRQAAADYHHDLGLRFTNEGNLPKAIEHLKIAVDYFPNNEVYKKSLRRAETLAATTRETRGVYIDQLSDAMRVEHQKLWIEAQQRIEEGMRHLELGSFNQAEQSFRMAYTRLELLPFADELREPEMRRVENLIQVTKERRSRQELDTVAQVNKVSNDQARKLRSYELRIEKERLDMMLRRALKARERRDYDECILLCEQVLKINPADGRASTLLVTARRERHSYLRQITADRWDEEHKLLSEEIREAMLPQLDLVVYPDDWADIDRRRSAPSRTIDNSEEETWRAEIVKKLDQQLTLEFLDNDIQDVVAFLQQNTEVNFVLDPEVVASGIVPPINMQVADIRLESALNFIMDLTDLRYSLQDEAILISTTDGVRGDAEMRIYDIRDLTLGLTQFPGPRLEIPEPGDTGSSLIPEIADENPPDIGELMEIIQEVVAPESWGDEGVDLAEYNGSMVVTQTPDVHDQIEELLDQLRKQRGVQINVKVRFLQVENALLEEIRFEWRDFAGPPVSGENAIGTVDGTPVAFAPLGANGLPYIFGGYYNHNDYATSAGRVGTPLADYFSQTNLRPDGGLVGDFQLFQDADGFLGRLVVNAVEKTRRGNILIQPDLTLFSGQRAHIVRMNQQAYIADYDVSGGQYDPIISILSYGTVLDVEAIASADRRYITLTMRPANAQVGTWRRFGAANQNVGNFPGGTVIDSGPGVASSPLFGIDYPLLVPELIYESVQTSSTIPDGGSLLLAGMNRSNSSRSHSGVPFLSHIPFLGRLFSSNGRTEQEFKQMIYVTGNIILFDEIEERL